MRDVVGQLVKVEGSAGVEGRRGRTVLHFTSSRTQLAQMKSPGVTRSSKLPTEMRG